MVNKYASIPIFCGQFGNHVQQISNAIYYCRENNIGLKFNDIQPLDYIKMFDDFLIEGNDTDIISSFFFIREDGIEDLKIKNYANFF